MAWATAIALAAAAGVCLITLWQQRNRPALLACVAFVALAAVSIFNAAVEGVVDPASFGQRLGISLFAVYPWALYRFARSLSQRAPWWVDRLVDGWSALLFSAVLVLPSFLSVSEGERSPVVQVVLAGIIVQVVGLPVWAAVSLWHSSRGQAAVVRHRLRLMAVSLLLMALAMLIAGFSEPVEAGGNEAASDLLGLLLIGSATVLIFTFAAPKALRASWAAVDLDRLQHASLQVIDKPTDEAVRGLLTAMAAISGGTGARYTPHSDREPVAVGTDTGSTVLTLPGNTGLVEIWTSKLWPFAGEEELQLLRNQLAVLDVSVARQLTEMELQRSNEDLQRFAYTASHDLQAPLRTVDGFIEIFLTTIDADALNDDQRQMLRFVQDGVARMQLLIRDLLTYSRLQVNQQAAVPIWVSEALDEVRALLRADLLQHGATLRQIGNARLRIDPQQLRQVLQNTVQNSLMHRRPDHPPRIEVSAHTAEVPGMVQLSIADNGRGIEAGYLPRAFDMFTQGQAGPGTGIGLAVVKRVAELNGGSVAVESDGRTGTTIRLVLPGDQVLSETV